MKFYNTVTLILTIFVAVTAYLSIDLVLVEKNLIEYFSFIGISLLLIILLRITLKRGRDDKDDD